MKGQEILDKAFSVQSSDNVLILEAWLLSHHWNEILMQGSKSQTVPLATLIPDSQHPN